MDFAHSQSAAALHRYAYRRKWPSAVGAARAPTFIIGFNATTTIRLLKNVKMPITTTCGNIES